MSKMTLKNIALIILCIFKSIQSEQHLNERVILKIYYSALDTTCVDFFRHELNDLISSQIIYYIHIELHPFAGCEFNEETKYIYCKLGQAETISNMHHLCAMYEINNLLPKSSEATYNINAIRYVVCTLSDMSEEENKLIDVDHCSNYTKEIDDKIDECEESNLDVFISNLNDLNSVNLTEVPLVVISESETGLFERRQKILDEMCRTLGPFKTSECYNRSSYTIGNGPLRSKGIQLESNFIEQTLLSFLFLVVLFELNLFLF